MTAPTRQNMDMDDDTVTVVECVKEGCCQVCWCIGCVGYNVGMTFLTGLACVSAPIWGLPYLSYKTYQCTKNKKIAKNQQRRRQRRHEEQQQQRHRQQQVLPSYTMARREGEQ